MRTSFPPLTKLHRSVAVAALLLLLGLQLLFVARGYSANWDEAHHLFDGYNIWTRHDYRLNAEVPPLVKLVAALPLLPMQLHVPPDEDRGSPTEAYLDGRAFVFGNGGDRVLFPARMMCVLFTLALGWTVYAAGHRMFGAGAGLLALLLFVFDPTVLAHGSLVNTDVGSACFFFAAVYAYYRYTREPKAWRLAVAAVATGLLLVTKYTGILIAPMLVLLAVAEAVGERSTMRLGKRLTACGAILLVAWVTVWAFYGFRDAPAPKGQTFSPALGEYIASMPNPHDAQKLQIAAHIHVLPQAYLWGLANTKKTEWQYTSYFFGRIYRHGPWQYFPASFLIKSTLPLLILLLLTPLFFVPEKGRRRALEFCFLLLPVGVYFAVITSSHFDIGARHMMPIYPFLYVLAGGGAVAAMRRARGWQVAVGVLVAWQIVGSVRIAPAYMAYGNEAWGGPRNVHRYLSDANVDWAQQLKAVKVYLDANHVTDCWFVYFADGVVEPSDYGVNCHRLPTPTALWWLNMPMDVPPVIDGTVLISDSEMEGVEFGDGPLNPYEAFRTMQPVGQIQYGVNVYRGRFAVPLAAALVDVRRSGELAQAGKQQEAFALAETAAQLAPGSAFTQLNLGDRLADQGNWVEARKRYEMADEIARTVKPELQADDPLPRITQGLDAARKHVPTMAH